MTPLPPISRLDHTGEDLVVCFDLPTGLPQVDGHFPGTPILPAVAQIDWAVRVAREHFTLAPRFSGLRALKFQRIVQPPGSVSLQLTRAVGGRAVAFLYSQDGSACSSGRLEFADASVPDRPLL